LKSHLGASRQYPTRPLTLAATEVIVIVTSEAAKAGCVGCMPSVAQLILIVVEAALACLIFIGFYAKVWRKQDLHGILQEINWGLWAGAIPTVFFFVLHLLIPIEFQQEFQFIILTNIFLMVLLFFVSPFQCILAQRELKQDAKAQVTYQMSIVEFEKKVVDPTGPFHAAFSKHLEAEHAVEAILFINAVTAWRNVSIFSE
jgi:hypothetical protein